jgi:hypothetical protein
MVVIVQRCQRLTAPVVGLADARVGRQPRVQLACCASERSSASRLASEVHRVLWLTKRRQLLDGSDEDRMHGLEELELALEAHAHELVPRVLPQQVVNDQLLLGKEVLLSGHLCAKLTEMFSFASLPLRLRGEKPRVP